MSQPFLTGKKHYLVMLRVVKMTVNDSQIPCQKCHNCVHSSTVINSQLSDFNHYSFLPHKFSCSRRGVCYYFILSFSEINWMLTFISLQPHYRIFGFFFTLNATVHMCIEYSTHCTHCKVSVCCIQPSVFDSCLEMTQLVISFRTK